MNAFFSTVATDSVAYVCRDIERTLGLGLDVPGLIIISNNTPFAKQVQKKAKHTQIILVEAPGLLDTWELLEHPTTIDALMQANITRIVVFKPTKKIERICEKNNWILCNPSATLSNTIEEKISQVEWLGPLTTFLPQHAILPCKEVAWNFEPFVLQFNRAHTGSGTILIESEEQLNAIKQKFPERPVRISAFISGPIITNNTVVTRDGILLGNISYQITGMPPYTQNPFATVGNDWGVIPQIIPYAAQSKFKEIAHAVGEKLREDGWKGAFGIDAIYEEKTDTVYLLEINARQPASVSYESLLQQKRRTKDNELLYTTAEAHIAALLNADMRGAKLIPIEDGAQVILRGTCSTYHLPQIMQELEALEISCIPYENNKESSDLLRIQTNKHLLMSHASWNSLGKQIGAIVTNNTQQL